MNIDLAFPSTYLKAADLRGRTARVTIKNVVMETIGSDQKPIMYFQGKEKGMVLNKTNANTIGMMYGKNTDDWSGGEIELFSAMVDFQGRPVEGLRVRIPPRKPAGNQQAAPRQTAPQQPVTNPFNDEEPPAHTGNERSYAQDLNDEIPF